jgi:hypothetical protein
MRDLRTFRTDVRYANIVRDVKDGIPQRAMLAMLEVDHRDPHSDCKVSRLPDQSASWHVAINTQIDPITGRPLDVYLPQVVQELYVRAGREIAFPEVGYEPCTPSQLAAIVRWSANRDRLAERLTAMLLGSYFFSEADTEMFIDSRLVVAAQ